MRMGPDELLFALDVRFKNDLTSGDITKAAQRLEENIRVKLPDVKKIKNENPPQQFIKMTSVKDVFRGS